MQKVEEKKAAEPQMPPMFPGMDPMGMMGMPGMMPGMQGMPMPGEEGKTNPFDMGNMNEEDMMKMQMVSAIYQKLMDGSADEKFMAEAKTMLGEEEVNTIKKQYEEIPEEEKKAAREQQKMYTAMMSNFEGALKEQGVDLTNPNVNPDAFAKGMSNMFSKVLKENAGNPEFESAMNALGDTVYNKELLYPPLKKLADLYPPWLAANKDKVDAKEYERFTTQLEMLKKICASFEGGEKNVAKLVEMITGLSEYGKPPEELAKQIEMPNLMGKMPIPGMGAGMPPIPGPE